MEMYNVARKTTTPGYRPECTATQTKAEIMTHGATYTLTPSAGFGAEKNIPSL